MASPNTVNNLVTNNTPEYQKWQGLSLGIDLTDAEADYFVTSGAASGRNTLNFTDVYGKKVVTRVINETIDKANQAVQNVLDFNTKFSSTIGSPTAEDAAAFSAIGGNLIQTVAQLKEQVAQGGGGGGSPSASFWTGTQAEFDAIKDTAPDGVYFVVE